MTIQMAEVATMLQMCQAWQKWLLWLGYDYGMEALLASGSTGWLSISRDTLVNFEDVAVYLFATFSAMGAGLGWLGSIFFVRKHLKV